MIFVYGTASSGKSELAEEISLKCSTKNGTELYYLATMENNTEAARTRIARHRKLREGKGFITLEEMYSPSRFAEDLRGGTVLIECMSNLCANVYYKTQGDKAADDAAIKKMSSEIINDIEAVNDASADTVIVSNDIFSDGIIYDDWTDSYMKLLAKVNASLAKKADRVIEVIN